MAKEITREMFEEYLEYDPESPSGLRWKVDRYGGRNHRVLRARAGDVAGHVCTNNKNSNYKYWDIKFRNKQYKVHRVIYCLYHGSLNSELQIDHIDGNPLNNRIDNLRAVTACINSRNMEMSTRNTSGVSGVRICINKNTGYTHIHATWMENGKHNVKSFSVNKYGYDLAFKLACEYRQEVITRLNENGYGYTERHGQE